MTNEANQLRNVLSERQTFAQKVLDSYGGIRESYADWDSRKRDMASIIAGNWDIVWPDNLQTTALPKIPNFPALAVADRARAVAAAVPSVVVRPEKPNDRPKKAAEKRERILQGYWYINRVGYIRPRWAADAMITGICAAKILPDLSKPIRDRFPVYSHLDPRYLYPGPIFAPGPFLDDAIVSYERRINEVESDYKVELSDLRAAIEGEMVRVIEWYDYSRVLVIVDGTPKAEATGRFSRGTEPGRQRPREVILDYTHDLGRCPIVIGTRPMVDGVYRGDFDSELGVLNTFNRLMTMHLDSAAMHVYPERKIRDVQNPEDAGPGATIVLDQTDSVYEYVAPPSGRFENHQLMRMMEGFAQQGSLMPPSRMGNPDESIISAAGVNATQSQYLEHVRSLQRMTLAPMLEAANEIAFKVDETFADVEKDIYGMIGGQAFRESYRPSKDIAGNYRNSVVYGFGTGLDEINQNVMVLQQWNGGDGLISRRTAMEKSPLVEDPIEEEKQIAIEQLTRATYAGLVAQAQAGTLDAQTLANIWTKLEDEGRSLKEAVAESTTVAPLAQPTGVAVGGAPGMAGAMAPQNAGQRLPPLEQILGGPRP